MVYPYYHSMRIFISSPGDVHEERNIAEGVIAGVDKTTREIIGLRTECIRWEDLPPLMPLRQDGQIQDVILREQVKSCNVFVLILNKRYGSTSSGHEISNTEREVETALEMINHGRSISFLSYFREIPANSDRGPQEEKVLELRKRLEERGLFYHVYKDPSDFQIKIINDLYYVLLKFKLSTTKQRALRCFWRLGIAEAQSIPGLAVIYPPVDRSYMVEERTEGMWLRRLAPHIVFEDYKCLNKLDKTLRLIGHHDIRTYSAYSFPHEVHDINRVWLCLPRNNPAKQQFHYYESEARFRFLPSRGAGDNRLIWFSKPDLSDPLEIRSPLTKYLHEQRAIMPDGEWRPELGRIYAKDYAILSRFTDKRGRKPTIFGTLKDYFIAGIRGLGTWGAGWFVDRKYKYFLNYEDYNDDEPVQLLLEVTYKNERIDDVRMVSNETAKYFAKEYDIRTIRKRIKDNLG